jgi:integrase/recombinase XerD
MRVEVGTSWVVPVDKTGSTSGACLEEVLSNKKNWFLRSNSGETRLGRVFQERYDFRSSRKRAKAAGFLTPVGCHTWRATGITIYLENDGRLEHAQKMAGHESPRTTKLYHRTNDEITLSEVERIRL